MWKLLVGLAFGFLIGFGSSQTTFSLATSGPMPGYTVFVNSRAVCKTPIYTQTQQGNFISCD